MIEQILQILALWIYLPKLQRIERKIGYKLTFNYIPARYIPAVMSCEMTKTWQNFGLNAEKGLNHFTMGGVANGRSTRFDPHSPEYQSWLGGYTLKLAPSKAWDFEDHFKLAIADQNSWLRRYGDQNPNTTTEGHTLVVIDKIQLGEYTGTLYEFGLTSHSDVGTNPKTLPLLYGLYGMAALYNLTNPNLTLRADNFMPKRSNNSYQTVDLKGFVAIFDIDTQVKTVLYGNGTVDTFPSIRDNLLKAMKSCEIVKIHNL